jgi:alkylhydroperoxidase family enzyme
MDPDIRLKSRKGRWVLLATVLGSGVAFLDATVVNVALPTIGKELHATVAQLQWIVNAYTLTLPRQLAGSVFMLEMTAMGVGGTMARISYVDLGTVTDPELAGYLADAREHGTPRLESQAIRAHVPAVLRTFSQSWRQVFRDGVLDHRVKELARVFIAKSLECGCCAAQRSDLGAAQGLTERAFDEVIDFRQSQRLTARDKAALRWAEAIAWDPGLADDDLWAELHRHFTEPELVELGYFIGLTMGQQRFLKTLGVRHGDLGRDSLAGLAPDAAAALAGS